ncbi:MAG: terminase large subunit [Planctomycetota bacterium]
MKSSSSRTTNEPPLCELIRTLPGYDPYHDSAGYQFHERHARYWIEFIERGCTFTQGERGMQPFVLEPWQKAIVANLFGWRQDDDETLRRFREAFVLIARKNGKSELLAALVVAVLFCDREPGAQLYSAAAKRDQAKHVFVPAKKMILRNPALRKRAEVMKFEVHVEDRVYKPIAAEATTEHGGSTHFAVIDEVHAQRDRDLMDVLETSMLARRNSLLVGITTADFAGLSICNEKQTYAEQVRDRMLSNPRLLPVLFAAKPGGDWHDPSVWRAANPNFGVSFREEEFLQLYRKAKDIPAFLNTFLRLHLNINTESNVRWIAPDRWHACDAARVRLESLAGRECYAALDLAANQDMTALALAAADPDGRIRLWLRYWVPADCAEQAERRDRVPYSRWIREGWITATPGDCVDYDQVERETIELCRQTRVRGVACDPFHAQHLMQHLQAAGIRVFEHRQTMQVMGPPTKEFERLVLGRQLIHGGNPVLTWNVANTMVHTDGEGNQRPSKKKSTGRIDGLVASVMASGMFTVPKTRKSVYLERGLRSL